jgi:hypothetical protein
MDFLKKVKKWLSKKTPAQRQDFMTQLAPASVTQPESRRSSMGSAGSYESMKSSVYSEPRKSGSSAAGELEAFGEFGNERKSLTILNVKNKVPDTKANIKVKGRGSGEVNPKRMAANSAGERRPVPAKIQQIVNDSKKAPKKDTKKKKS